MSLHPRVASKTPYNMQNRTAAARILNKGASMFDQHLRARVRETSKSFLIFIWHTQACAACASQAHCVDSYWVVNLQGLIGTCVTGLRVLYLQNQ